MILRLSSCIEKEAREDAEYSDFLDRQCARFHDIASKEPLFTTDCGNALWAAYINAIAASRPECAQHYNCRTCRAFIERFGSLVTIDKNGATKSALWDVIAIPEIQAGIDAVKRTVERATVTGVFLSAEKELGEPIKGRRHKLLPPGDSNAWHHMSVILPDSKVFKSHLTAQQVIAEKLGEYHNVVAALSQVNAGTLAKAVQLMESEALYRNEKVTGPARWLHELKASLPKNRTARRNLIMRAVALAPTGFCHPRSSVWWSLLDDLEAVGLDCAARRFRAKMAPDQYQRPQAAPSNGAIDAAEKLIEKLGIARSLERRFARIDEIEKVWERGQDKEEAHGTVFGHLKLGGVSAQTVVAPQQAITWAKFARTVLPSATKIKILAPAFGSYSAYATAEHADAPPILQWDSPDKRNPVSFYLYIQGSSATQWGISNGWRDVRAVSLNPEKWHGEFGHVANSALFIIDGCVDSKEDTGNALFPETLRSELHGCRAVIERYSATATLGGRDKASACGLMFSGNSPVTVRVTTQVGTEHEYRIDRWD